MENSSMPANISYTLLVHAGSYKDFEKKMEKNFPELEIKNVKQKAVHYYIVLITETGKIDYDKKSIYTLPIMAMREEFSNYIFVKSVKAYNNVLKLMLDGKNNKEAPYELFLEMLTPFEKYKYGKVNKDTKTISITEKEKGEEKTTTYFNSSSMYDKETLEAVFFNNNLKTDGQDIDFISLIKKQKLVIGVI